MDMQAFVVSYLETALWSSTDNGYFGANDRRNNKRGQENGGEPLDKNFSIEDIGDATRKQAETDCAHFVEMAGAKLEGLDANRVAHDFWLTRNGHGAGFWDGDYAEPLGTELTKLSKTFGSFDLYVGDDGKVYGQ
jgi:hypothetical protein